ncbi:MAG: peptidoglycan editing factor PgeF [Chlorobiaceae bacterium]|nr:peptidoglycan editing factor PgeF [Chlorobiaceae bacterium]
MRKIESNGLVSYEFETDGFNSCLHGFFTRHGGVSPTPWKSLNQGGTVGDRRENVIANRKRIFDTLNRPVESIFDVWQVHGTASVCTSKPRSLEAPHQRADAIFTDNPEITLFMRFADCVPILLFDPVRKVAGIIHAGWKGTVNNIIREAITCIKHTYGVDNENIIAGIGPSIGPDHYEVGNEVRRQIQFSFGNYSDNLLNTENNKTFFDLWRANEYLLKKQGIRAIESARICTACNTDDWYSHRAEKGATGRFGAFIAIKDQLHDRYNL